MRGALVARSTLAYESILATRDAPVVAAMRELSAQYPRYGLASSQLLSKDSVLLLEIVDHVLPGSIQPADKKQCESLKR